MRSPCNESSGGGGGYVKIEKHPYRRIETLEEYVLIDPDRISVEHYRRNERGNWELVGELADQEAVMQLELVGLAVPVELLYDEIEFP